MTKQHEPMELATLAHDLVETLGHLDADLAGEEERRDRLMACYRESAETTKTLEALRATVSEALDTAKLKHLRKAAQAIGGYTAHRDDIPF